jgi:hypothetical protein
MVHNRSRCKGDVNAHRLVYSAFLRIWTQMFIPVSRTLVARSMNFLTHISTSSLIIYKVVLENFYSLNNEIHIVYGAVMRYPTIFRPKVSSPYS